MPRLGRNKTLDETPLSVFESIIVQAQQMTNKRVIPLHQGKTAYTSPVELREWDAVEFDYPPHHDGPSCGTEMLIDAIRSKLENRLGSSIDPRRILVTSGITHALSVVFHAILEPGDEVIVLSPQWLFASGLVRAAKGVPVEVPYFSVVTDAIEAVPDRILERLTSKTRAIYFNTPNNPTGRSLSAKQVNELADLAESRGLWLISDNAYEYYDYSPDGFVDPAALPRGSENTFAAYSFSKTFGLTGYRIGYLLSPSRMAEIVRKFGLYSIYSVPTCSQFVALSALRGGPRIIDAHRDFVIKARDLTVKKLTVPATIPDGGFYTFLDLNKWKAGVDHFISQCITEGVSLAPGYAFGEHYQGHARLCYSAVGLDELAEGIRAINSVYERCE